MLMRPFLPAFRRSKYSHCHLDVTAIFRGALRKEKEQYKVQYAEAGRANKKMLAPGARICTRCLE